MTAEIRPRRSLAASAGHWLGGLPRLFWVLWAGILINRLGTLVEPFLGVYLVTVRGFPVTTAGGVLAVYALGSLVSQILGGWLADALGRRAALTTGMLANGAALIALGYATAPPAVITATFAAGATVDMYRPAAQALVADLIPAAGRTRAYGLISWAANLGFSAAMLSGGMLAQAGFRWLFWADALTCAAFAALAWHALPTTPARPVAHSKEPGRFGDVLRDRLMAAFMLVVLGQMVVYQQAFTTLPVAMHAAGFPPRDYGLVMALNGVVIVVVQPLAGTWLGQRDHSVVIGAGTALLGAGFAVTSLASSTLGYGGAAVIWTLGEIAMAAAGSTVAADLAPARLRGRYLGLYGAVCSLGALLAPLGGTQLLRAGAPALWLTCSAVAGAAALGQLALASAIHHRTDLTLGTARLTRTRLAAGKAGVRDWAAAAWIRQRTRQASWPAAVFRAAHPRRDFAEGTSKNREETNVSRPAGARARRAPPATPARPSRPAAPAAPGGPIYPVDHRSGLRAE